MPAWSTRRMLRMAPCCMLYGACCTEAAAIFRLYLLCAATTGRVFRVPLYRPRKRNGQESDRCSRDRDYLYDGCVTPPLSPRGPIPLKFSALVNGRRLQQTEGGRSGTGLTPATSAPEAGSPRHICTRTGLTAPTSAPGPGAPMSVHLLFHTAGRNRFA